MERLQKLLSCADRVFLARTSIEDVAKELKELSDAVSDEHSCVRQVDEASSTVERALSDLKNIQERLRFAIERYAINTPR